MAMDKDVTQVIEGVAVGKGLQALLRKYGDVMFAQAFLYTPEQYATDLTKLTPTPYIPKSTAGVQDAPKTIGDAIIGDAGYAFVSGPGFLTGTGGLTATKYTYQAAIGQKVSGWKQLSGAGSSIIGLAGTALAATDSLKRVRIGKEYQLLVTAMSASLLTDGAVRSLGVDGTITAPSGFDVSKQPAFQYLNPGEHAGLQSNLRALSERNNQLTAEGNALRAQVSQLTGRAMGAIQASNPVVTVNELARNPNEELKRQQFMGNPQYQPNPTALPHNIQFMSKIQQLEKAFL